MIEVKTLNDLKNLISNQVEENLHLDYKSADALGKTDGKKKEISKDISAFANSDGGIIIYGIREFSDQHKRHLPEFIDPVERTKFSKEWLEQVINTNISPKIKDIKILPISYDSNKVVYVVIINKSNTAHQASDYRYYKRYNFESVAMYDYEVRDIMSRNKLPKIELIFEIEEYSFKYDEANYNPMLHYSYLSLKSRTTNKLLIRVHNIGGIYANYVNCYLEVPSSILKSEKYDHIENYFKNNIEYKRIYCDNTIREIKKVNPPLSNVSCEYWPSKYEPILPGTNMGIKEIELNDNFEPCSEIIYWEVYADNAEMISGQVKVKDINILKKQV